MLRRLFTLTAVLSLLLSAATVVLWVRSYRVADQVSYMHLLRAKSPQQGGPTNSYLNVSLYSNRGVLDADWTYDAQRHTPGYSAEPSVPSGRLHGGFWYGKDELGDIYVGCPWWSLSLLMAVLPLVFGVLFWRDRKRPGVCHACGYDLRATSDRCPECGAAARPTAHPKAVASMRQS